MFLIFAHSWFGQVKAGKTFAEIAAPELTSKRCMEQVIDLAFLTFDIVRGILDRKKLLGSNPTCVCITIFHLTGINSAIFSRRPVRIRL
jgi:hypothetical protein